LFVCADPSAHEWRTSAIRVQPEPAARRDANRHTARSARLGLAAVRAPLTLHSARSARAASPSGGCVALDAVRQPVECGSACNRLRCHRWPNRQPHCRPRPPIRPAAARQHTHTQPSKSHGVLQSKRTRAVVGARKCCASAVCLYSSEHRCRAGEHSGSRGTRCAPAPLLQYAVSASGRMCACACIGHGCSGARRTRNAAQRYANDAAKQQAPPCDVRSGSASLLQLRGHAARCGVCATAFNALNAPT
jgi:hypothetical protein